jgi:hypothetical protein
MCAIKEQMVATRRVINPILRMAVSDKKMVCWDDLCTCAVNAHLQHCPTFIEVRCHKTTVIFAY